MAIKATDKALYDAMWAYRLKYAGPNNPVGKDHSEFTSADLAKVDSDILHAVRYIINAENYQYIDGLVPKNMDRAEFTRAVLRELARRGEVTYPYNTFPTNDPALQNKPVTVQRFPFYFDGAKNEKVTQTATNVVMHDGFVDIAQNNVSAIRLIDDVGSQLGIKGGRSYELKTDAEAFDFGYAVGAQQAFRQNDGLKLTLNVAPTRPQTARILAFEDELTKGKTPEQIAQMQSQIAATRKQMADVYIQQNHCEALANIFEPGRALDNKEAMARGFIQARVDIRSGFAPISDRVGLNAECPSKKAQGR